MRRRPLTASKASGKVRAGRLGLPTSTLSESCSNLLNYVRVGLEGVEPSSTEPQSIALPLSYSPRAPSGTRTHKPRLKV